MTNRKLRLTRQAAAITGHRGANRHGAMLVLILVLMIGFMVTVAFSIDIALMHLSRSELRSATDAASKAAATELARTLDVDLAIQRGQEIAARNAVYGEPLLLHTDDFTFGRSSESATGKFVFDTTTRPLNSVRVNGRRTTGSLSGAVPLLFGNLFGVDYFEPQVDTTATYIERDVVLVVDRSGSMWQQKWIDLNAAIQTFVSTLGTTPVNEAVGLASYNDQASSDVALTTNLDEITNTLGALPVGGWTSISRGMTAGKDIMDASARLDFVEKTMIVMTDGRHNRGPEPRDVAQVLAADGVTIHTITFGDDADQTRMEEVADIGNGRYFHALTGEQLEAIYREIALTLSTMMTQ